MKAKHWLYLVLFIVGMSVLSFGCHWFGDGAATMHKEFDPSAMLKKYEWFRNQSQYIATATQNVTNQRNLAEKIKSQFEVDNGTDHKSWDQDTRHAYQSKLDFSEQQALALVATRNSLVADYNAESSKFNWAPFKDSTNAPPKKFEEIK